MYKRQQQTQQNLIQQLEQELFSLDTHISNLKDALEITDEDTIEDNETCLLYTSCDFGYSV